MRRRTSLVGILGCMLFGVLLLGVTTSTKAEEKGVEVNGRIYINLHGNSVIFEDATEASDASKFCHIYPDYDKDGVLDETEKASPYISSGTGTTKFYSEVYVYGLYNETATTPFRMTFLSGKYSSVYGMHDKVKLSVSENAMAAINLDIKDDVEITSTLIGVSSSTLTTSNEVLPVSMKLGACTLGNVYVSNSATITTDCATAVDYDCEKTIVKSYEYGVSSSTIVSSATSGYTIDANYNHVNRVNSYKFNTILNSSINEEGTTKKAARITIDSCSYYATGLISGNTCKLYGDTDIHTNDVTFDGNVKCVESASTINGNLSIYAKNLSSTREFYGVSGATVSGNYICRISSAESSSLITGLHANAKVEGDYYFVIGKEAGAALIDASTEVGDRLETHQVQASSIAGIDTATVIGNYDADIYSVNTTGYFYVMTGTSTIGGTESAKILDCTFDRMNNANGNITSTMDIQMQHITLRNYSAYNNSLANSIVAKDEANFSVEYCDLKDGFTLLYNNQFSENVLLKIKHIKTTAGTCNIAFANTFSQNYDLTFEDASLGSNFNGVNNNTIKGQLTVDVNRLTARSAINFYMLQKNLVTKEVSLDCNNVDFSLSGSTTYLLNSSNVHKDQTTVYVDHSTFNGITMINEGTFDKQVNLTVTDSAMIANATAMSSSIAKQNVDINWSNISTKGVLILCNNSTIYGNTTLTMNGVVEAVAEGKKPEGAQYVIYGGTFEGNVVAKVNESYCNDLRVLYNYNSIYVGGNVDVSVKDSLATKLYGMINSGRVLGDTKVSFTNCQADEMRIINNFNVSNTCTVSIVGGAVKSELYTYNPNSISNAKASVSVKDISLGASGSAFTIHQAAQGNYEAVTKFEHTNLICGIDKVGITNNAEKKYSYINLGYMNGEEEKNRIYVAGKYTFKDIDCEQIQLTGEPHIIPEGVTVQAEKLVTATNAKIIVRGTLDVGSVSGATYLLCDGGTIHVQTEGGYHQYFPLRYHYTNEDIMPFNDISCSFNKQTTGEVNTIWIRYNKTGNVDYTITAPTGYCFGEHSSVVVHVDGQDYTGTRTNDKTVKVTAKSQWIAQTMDIEFEPSPCELIKTVSDPNVKQNVTFDETNPVYDLSTVRIESDAPNGTISYGVAEGSVLPSGLSLEGSMIVGTPTKLNDEGTDVVFDVTCRNEYVAKLTLNIKVTGTGAATEQNTSGVTVSTTQKYVDLAGVPVVIAAINDTTTGIYLDQNRDGVADSETPICSGDYSSYYIYGVYNKTITQPIYITMKSGQIYRLYGARDSIVEYDKKDAITIDVAGGIITSHLYGELGSTVRGNIYLQYKAINYSDASYKIGSISIGSATASMRVEVKDGVYNASVSGKYVVKDHNTFDKLYLSNCDETNYLEVAQGDTLTVGTLLGSPVVLVKGTLQVETIGSSESGNKRFLVEPTGVIHCTKQFHGRNTTIYNEGTVSSTGEFIPYSDITSKLYNLGGTSNIRLRDNYYPVTYHINYDNISVSSTATTAWISYKGRDYMMALANKTATIVVSSMYECNVEATYQSASEVEKAATCSGTSISFAQKEEPIELNITYVPKQIECSPNVVSQDGYYGVTYTKEEPLFDLKSIDIFNDIREVNGSPITYELAEESDALPEGITLSGSTFVGTAAAQNGETRNVIVKVTGHNRTSANVAIAFQILACDHTYDTELSYNETEHWKLCTKCGYVIEKTKHTNTVEYNTDGHWQGCEDCGYLKDVTAHTLAMQKDGTGHWKKCLSCEYKTEVAEHAYPEAYNFDGSYHYKICTVCTYQSANKAHDLIAKKDDETHWRECDTCDYVSYSYKHNLELKSDETGHWNECTSYYCDYQTELEEHTFDDGIVTVPATLEETGLKTVTCTVCETTKEVVIPKLEPEHVHSFSEVYATNDTQHWRVCACGKKEDVGDHDWVDKYDEEKHWKECSICNLKQDIKNHIPTVTYTEEGHKSSCTKCDYTTKVVEHTLSVVAGVTKHHYKCSDCEYRTDEVEHTYDEGKVVVPATVESAGEKKITCTTCGHSYVAVIPKLIPPHYHNFEHTVYTNDEENHWLVCVCGEISQLEVHQFDTATDATGHGGICKACGYESDKIAHTYVVKEDDTGHWNECSNCGYHEEKETHSLIVKKNVTGHYEICANCTYETAVVEHSYDEGVVTTEPTEQAEGEKTYTCSTCGYKKIETVDKLVHSHTLVAKENATGHWEECSKCDYKEETAAHTLVQNKSDAGHWDACSGCKYETTVAEHSYDAGVVTIEPTEEAEGEKTYTCGMCGYKKKEAIAKLVHTHTLVDQKDATGHWKECSSCDYKSTVVEHDFDEGVVTTEPTEEAEGEKTYTCSACGYKKVEVVEKLAHTHTLVAKENATGHWKECSKCDYKTDVTEHSYGEGVVTKPATVEAVGEKTYTCSVCGYEKVEAIDKLKPATSETSATTTEVPSTTTETPATTTETTTATTEAPSNAGGDLADQKPAEVGETLMDAASGATYKVVMAEQPSVSFSAVEDKTVKAVVIPDHVEIGGVSYAVTTIEPEAFKGCTKLETVTIPDAVDTISDGAFDGCKALKSLTVPSKSKLKVIGKKAFYNCSKLKKIVIPASVTKIGSKAFYNCKNLTSITIKTTKLKDKNVGSKAFTKAGSKNYKKLVVKVPKKCKKTYKKMLQKRGLHKKAKIK